ncbi:MAG TPA: DUF5606 domain-containing protein [Bacteroidaceae bacterium]|nr:DUF5606 domain-containing protein [Bacteroidaceae bacterium]
MLKEIVSVSGKPGLYRLISRGKNSIIIESLDDVKKRIPIQGNEKVISLGDISIFTDDGEISLREVFLLVGEKSDNSVLDFNFRKATNDELGKYFEQILSGYDRERVYPSHIKKVFSWYNILVNQGINDFSESQLIQEAEQNLEHPEQA